MAFNWISNKLRDVKDKIIDVKDSIVDSVENIADCISEGSAKVWNATTGRANFLEAERLYEKIEKDYTKAFDEYEKSIYQISKDIEIKISKINYHKKDIYLNHFDRFKNLGNKLHNLSIKGNHFEDYFDDSILKINNKQGVRNKAELFTIDFNNLKFNDIAFGVLTLGFSTRKRAKESLSKVKEEESRIKEEIEKMNAQVRKSKVIFESINNINEYFEELIKNYVSLLDRFEFGIKSQLQKNILSGKYVKSGKIDFKMMPILHIKEFQALFNLSIVLKQMATLGYLTDNCEIKYEDIKIVEHIKTINNELLVA